nr:hypothetical protein [uncultured Roseococcus sp.]
MGRRCACERLLEFWEGDPRFALAGASAAAIWLRLVRVLQRMGGGSVLRFGSVVGSLSETALAIRTQETELEPALNRLAELGLLAREVDGALSIPWLAEGAARASSARNNGLRGGRPRKGESKEDMHARRQGHLALPFSGGAAAAAETQPIPEPESSRASTESKSISNSGQSIDARELYALTEELAEIAGMDPARGGYNGSDIRMWLTQGATPDLLREVVRTVRQRSRAVIKGFRYFNDAVAEALTEGRAAASPGEAQERSDYAEAFEDFLAGGGNPVRFPSPAEWRAAQARRAA